MISARMRPSSAVPDRSSSVKARALAAVVLLGSFAHAPSAGADEDPRPIVAQGGGLGPGWVALKVESDGSNVNIAFKAHGLKTPNAFQIFKYNAQDRFLGGFGGLRMRSERGVYVDMHPPAGPNIVYEDTSAPESDVWEWGPEVGTLDGVMKLLIWSGGPQAGWTWRLRGGSGVRLIGLDKGRGAHVIMSHDMRGLADVRVHPVDSPCPCVAGPWGARVSVDRSKTIIIENTAVGFYLDMADMPPFSNNLLSIAAPFGEQRCLPGCDFPHFRSGWPAGSYTFRVDAGMGAPFSGLDDLVAVVVDARLPELPSPLLVFKGESAIAGEPGATVPASARLTDATGAPVPDADVTFQLHDGDKVVSASAVTSADGVARASLVLPDRAGLWLVTATAAARDLTVAPATMAIQTTP